MHDLARIDSLYLGRITPYDGYLREELGDVSSEIERLSQEMASINIDSMKFDKWDYAAIVAIGLAEAGTDLLLGDPRKGLSKMCSDKNNSLGKYLNEIHNKWGHSGQPIDFQGDKFGGSTHRARTFGHDLMMFPLAIYSLCTGQFIDGYYTDKIYQPVRELVNQWGSAYGSMRPDKAILAYIIHMAADFCSTHSLPVPGFGVLAHLPSREIRKLVNSMYEDGFNLRHVVIQGIPVACTEILMRIYFWFRHHSSEFSSEAKKEKRNKLLLMAHSLAMLVNMEKVYFAKDPVLLNLPMLMRVIWLTWSVSKEQIRKNRKAIEKCDLGVIKSKLEALQTMVLLDRAVYYTKELDKLFLKEQQEFNRVWKNNRRNREHGLNRITGKIQEIRKLTSSNSE